MRRQFIKTLEDTLDLDERATLLLGDISVFGFRNTLREHPDRAINMGILEASTIGVAAGMAKMGLIPTIHSIAPFIVERAFEQIKIDLAYQNLGANIVTVGASYDYAALGCTHHCPGDAGILYNVPNIEIIVPGNGSEFSTLYRQTYSNGRITYFRLSERENEHEQKTTFGKLSKIKDGKLCTVVVVGPLLDLVVKATDPYDVSVLYCTTLNPFDGASLLETHHKSSEKLLFVEPFYTGTTFCVASNFLSNVRSKAISIGIPREFRHNYGSSHEHDVDIGFTVPNIRNKLLELIHE